MGIYYALLVIITFERLAELVVSQRHATELLRRGGSVMDVLIAGGGRIGPGPGRPRN